MSTFDGLVAEFPDIRIDFFRGRQGHRPPLACFLSHIHSDHLAGLESLRAPFVYCSAATKEMLLRLERFPCRINYAKGILEARMQTYKHLKTLLKPLPLDTPTVMELEPGNHIQVTLFNANHCPGAVMFLIEGQGKAILYTGDIRSEPWFVNAISRSPALVEYSYGLKTVDTIYLDTSFTEDIHFQTKAEGIRELLQKVARYPDDTIFHFQAWTYGYEDVWIALSNALGSKVHVDDYKWLMYRSLNAQGRMQPNKFHAQFPLTPEAPALVGFMCGNKYHDGCLTWDENARIHSCERGNYCTTVRANHEKVVWIQPIITRLADGKDVPELGVGGGGDDLEREAELDYLTPAEVETLLEIICDTDDLSDGLKETVRNYLVNAVSSGRNISLELDHPTLEDGKETTVKDALQAIAKKSQFGQRSPPSGSNSEGRGLEEGLPKRITFPYSRHSSYPELRRLVEVFRPKDVWPCTVAPGEWLRDGISMEGLFGKYCSGKEFRHDRIMETYAAEGRKDQLGEEQEQESQATTVSSVDMPLRGAPVTDGPELVVEMEMEEQTNDNDGGVGGVPLSILHRHEDGVSIAAAAPPLSQTAQAHMLNSCALGRRAFGEYDEPDGADTTTAADDDDDDDEIGLDLLLQDSQSSQVPQTLPETRRKAFRAMLNHAKGTLSEGDASLGLLSVSDHHTELDKELGEG